MLEVQRFLRSGGTVDALLSTYSIKAKRHSLFPNLVLLKYDQIASDFSARIVQECRGIILDEANDWNVVSRSFDKFFNLGEGHAATIDWSTARVQEKLDGSLICIYHYSDTDDVPWWHAATSGTPDASGQVHGVDELTFDQYFWQTFLAQGGRFPNDSDLCFSFELMGPHNRIVVEHPSAHLRVIGCRRLSTGEEIPADEAARIVNIAPVRSFPLTSFEEIAATFPTMSPLSQEGYVVVDGAFNRVKVKSPAYVSLHHAKDGMSDRAFVDIARRGETSEVEAAFPEIKARLSEVRSKFASVRDAIADDYATIAGEVTQKDFALKAVPKPWSGVLFQMRKGTSVNDALLRADVDHIIAWMGRVA